MPEGNSERDSGSTYTAGNADISGTSRGSTDADNGLSQNSEGVNEQTTTSASTDAYIAEIADTTTALLSVNLVIVVAIFLCFGALCVRTLIRSFEVK